MRGRAPILVPGLLLLLYLLSGCGSADPEAMENDRSEMVVHTTLRPPNQDIYLVEERGAEPRRLTDHPVVDYSATFSPDGRWLVFTSEREGNADVFVMPFAPGDTTAEARAENLTRSTSAGASASTIVRRPLPSSVTVVLPPIRPLPSSRCSNSGVRSRGGPGSDPIHLQSSPASL